jgi:hypothetical protein
LPEADMLGARHKPGPDSPPVGLEPQLESRRVGLTADKTGTCMWQLFHKSKIRYRTLIAHIRKPRQSQIGEMGDSKASEHLGGVAG